MMFSTLKHTRNCKHSR